MSNHHLSILTSRCSNRHFLLDQCLDDKPEKKGVKLLSKSKYHEHLKYFEERSPTVSTNQTGN